MVTSCDIVVDFRKRRLAQLVASDSPEAPPVLNTSDLSEAPPVKQKMTVVLPCCTVGKHLTSSTAATVKEVSNRGWGELFKNRDVFVEMHLT